MNEQEQTIIDIRVKQKYSDIIPLCIHHGKRDSGDCIATFKIPEFWCDNCTKAKHIKDVLSNYEVLKKRVEEYLKYNSMDGNPIRQKLCSELQYRATNEL